jgi:hypothetical protein
MRYNDLTDNIIGIYKLIFLIIKCILDYPKMYGEESVNISGV